MKHIFLLAAFVAILPLSAPAAHDEPRLLSVHGEGEIKVKPDLAFVTLQVQTKAKDAKAAQQKNASEMARVQKALKDSFHIEAKDIQTTAYNVNPNYRYDNGGRQTFLGYTVDHGLIVTLRKLDQAGELLDQLVGKGTEDVAVLLSGIQFDTDKRKEYEMQALELAMKNAEARASTLARLAKQNLKGVHRISDSSVNVRPFLGNYQPRMAKMNGAEMQAADTQVSTGEIQVNSTVSVEYEMN